MNQNKTKKCTGYKQSLLHLVFLLNHCINSTQCLQKWNILYFANCSKHCIFCQKNKLGRYLWKKNSCLFPGNNIFILDEFLLLHVCCSTQIKLFFIVLRAEETTNMSCLWIFRQQSCNPISLVYFHCSRHRAEMCKQHYSEREMGWYVLFLYTKCN